MDARVSIGGEAHTTTKITFTFFENTTADNCVVFGPATTGGSAGYLTSLVVQAVESGGD